MRKKKVANRQVARPAKNEPTVEPALASPEAMEAADSLYFLRETDGRIMLAPDTSLLRIERENSDGG